MQGKPDWPLKIGEVARKLRIPEPTLRFYERMGLIEPARTPGGTRQYFPQHVRRLQSIFMLTEAGVGLEEIREIVRARNGCRTGSESSHKVGQLLEQRLAEIRAKRKRLQRLERELVVSLKLVAQCRACGNRPDSTHCPDCPVNRNLGDPPLLDLFWE